MYIQTNKLLNTPPLSSPLLLSSHETIYTCIYLYLGDNFTMRLKPGEAHKTAAMIEKEQKEAKKAFQAVDRDGLETHQVFI